jgi:hypothetical protein
MLGHKLGCKTCHSISGRSNSSLRMALHCSKVTNPSRFWAAANAVASFSFLAAIRDQIVYTPSEVWDHEASSRSKVVTSYPPSFSLPLALVSQRHSPQLPRIPPGVAGRQKDCQDLMRRIINIAFQTTEAMAHWLMTANQVPLAVTFQHFSHDFRRAKGAAAPAGITLTSSVPHFLTAPVQYT